MRHNLAFIRGRRYTRSRVRSGQEVQVHWGKELGRGIGGLSLNYEDALGAPRNLGAQLEL